MREGCKKKERGGLRDWCERQGYERGMIVRREIGVRVEREG